MAETILLLALWLSVADGLVRDNIPTPDSFLRAGMWRAAVIKGHIYLDGGQVSQEGYGELRASNPINATLSIDCTKPWSPEDVEIEEISRPEGMLVLSEQAILHDPKSSSFYVWGGHAAYGQPAPDLNFWRFTVNDQGVGSWGRESPNNADVFATMEGSDMAAYASTNDAAFIFGGKVVNSEARLTRENVKGFKTFNFTTWVWDEEAEGPYSHDGSLWGASATFVPKFGSQGIIILLGGMTRPNEPAPGYEDWGTVDIYDLAEKKWHTQVTSGDTPPRRSHHCAVGVDDTRDDGSYEIFIYGGGYRDRKVEYGTVYALSVPGFTWTIVSNETDRQRTDHVCVNVDNNSQLVSLGGVEYLGKDIHNWEVKDRYPRGIAIFDMNVHSWIDSYDPGIGSYATHGDIRSFYENGGSADWSSEEVRALFQQDSPTPGNDSDQDVGATSSTPVGAIAGGAVGGVAGIAILATAVWFFLRRRRRQVSQLAGGEEAIDRAKTPPPGYLGELVSNDPSMMHAELPDPRRLNSDHMRGAHVLEMDGSGVQR